MADALPADNLVLLRSVILRRSSSADHAIGQLSPRQRPARGHVATGPPQACGRVNDVLEMRALLAETTPPISEGALRAAT